MVRIIWLITFAFFVVVLYRACSKSVMFIDREDNICGCISSYGKGLPTIDQCDDLLNHKYYEVIRVSTCD